MQQKKLVMDLSPEDGVGVPNLLFLWSRTYHILLNCVLSASPLAWSPS